MHRPMTGGGLALPWRLARREMRGGLKGFRVFLACLAIGVGAIAAVGSLSDAVMGGLRADARVLLGGDLDVRLSNVPAGADQVAYLESNAARVSRVVEMRAMARSGPEAAARQHLVELKAVDDAYPLVGAVGLEPDTAIGDALARHGDAWGAVADSSLLLQLGISVGDRLVVGNAAFVLSAVLAKEPDKVASVVRFGPSFLINAAALPETGLVQPGSQIQYRYRLLLAPGADGKLWAEDIKKAFPTAGWRIRGLDEAAPGVERFIERLTLFLTFAGLTALLVGGIGIGNAVRAYLEGRTATIATLKCLGAPSPLVFRTYLLQILILAGFGIGLGLLAGALLPIVAVRTLGDLLPVTPELGLYPLSLAVAAAFGLLTALTFALWPLGRAGLIPAQALFRARVAPLEGRPRGAVFWAAVASAVLLALLVVAAADKKSFALAFVFGAIATLLLLRGGALLLVRLAARVHPRRPAWRLAVANLHRPGAATTGVIVSMGLGLAVLVAIGLLQGVLSSQIGERLPALAPAFFFVDIQSDQAAAFERAVTSVPGTAGFRRMPSLRGRIVAIDGVDVDKRDIRADAQWAVQGDRALTYSAALPDDSRLVAGSWWPADYQGPPLISLDASLAEGFAVGVGDSLTLNVLGREVEAKIASLREIDWHSLRFDFAIIFSPGVLERAPHSHIAAVQAAPAAEPAVERAATAGFPNVSAIRIREALEAAARMLEGVSGAVRATAGVAILAGMMVLAGAIAADQKKRIYDAVVFKVLGARRRTVLAAFLIEYGLLGLLTGIVAAMVGSLTAWAVTRFLMDMEWTFLPGVAAATILLAVVVTIVLGFAGTWRALGQKAAPHLRNR